MATCSHWSPLGVDGALMACVVGGQLPGLQRGLLEESGSACPAPAAASQVPAFPLFLPDLHGGVHASSGDMFPIWSPGDGIDLRTVSCICRDEIPTECIARLHKAI